MLTQLAAPPAHAQTIAVASLIQPDGTLKPDTTTNGALDLRGWNVALDPKRGPLLSRAHAAPSAGTWSALPNSGLNNDVYAFAVSGSTLYVGGSFTSTSDSSVTNLNNITKLTCGTVPPAPTLTTPAKNTVMDKTTVKFDWTDSPCATSYVITVKNLTTGARATKTVTPSKTTHPPRTVLYSSS